MFHSHQELTRDTLPITVAAFFEQGGQNNCEKVVCMDYPEVALALDWLSQKGTAQLTGTGACVFASFTSEAEALAVMEEAKASFKQWRCFVAKGINQSPAIESIS